VTEVSLLLSQSTGRDKCAGAMQYLLCFVATFVGQKEGENEVFDPRIEHRFAYFKGFEKTLSSARKMMKFAKWLDEIEKIKFVLGKFVTREEGWNPWWAVQGVSHVLSMVYYLLDNIVFFYQVYLQNVMPLYPNRSKWNPSIADSVPYQSWPSTRMLKLYNRDRGIQLYLKKLLMARNLVSTCRLVLAITLEVVRMVQCHYAVRALRNAQCRTISTASEIASLEAQASDAGEKMIQNNCNFFKLIGKLAFDGVIPFSFGIDERRGAVLGVIAQVIGISRNWPLVKRLKKKHEQALHKLGERSQSVSEGMAWSTDRLDREWDEAK